MLLATLWESGSDCIGVKFLLFTRLSPRNLDLSSLASIYILYTHSLINKTSSVYTSWCAFWFAACDVNWIQKCALYDISQGISFQMRSHSKSFSGLMKNIWIIMEFCCIYLYCRFFCVFPHWRTIALQVDQMHHLSANTLHREKYSANIL